MRRCLLALALLASLAQAQEPVPLTTDEGFRVPQPGTVLPFPETHGAHPDFKIEWWYLTGHLFAESGARFGFQATFFRSAGEPPDGNPDAPDDLWQTRTLHLAHMALTEVTGDTFHFEGRLQRQGWDAYAREGHLDVRNGNWSLVMTDAASEIMHLQATMGASVALDLSLSPAKPRVIFGEDGTSRKGADPAARSYYVSFTRLAATGTVELDGEPYRVQGEAWMDHEIASRQLDPELEGWDWTAIQLRDGREIKAYILRQDDGQPSPFSALIWIGPDGELSYQAAEDFSWERTEWWTSPATGVRYPIGVRIQTRDPLSGESVVLTLVPLRADQEIRDSRGDTRYWEGACWVLDAQGEEVGAAYLELVGYDGGVSGLR